MTTMAEIWKGQGRQEGRSEMIHQMVLRMLAIGIPIEKVATTSGLSFDEIERLSSCEESHNPR